MNARIVNKHIVFSETTDITQLRGVFPNLKESTIKGTKIYAVTYNLISARLLNNLGYKVQSPIRTVYDWPGIYKPRWYQLDTAEFFTLNRRAYCLSEMRTGKTLSALWAVDYLRRTKKVQSTLIVAPLSTLWDVWEQNIFESFPMRTYAVLHGPRKKRLELLKKKCNFYIINPAGIGIIKEELAARPDIDMVIVDEIAGFRNATSKTLFKPLNEILNKQGIDRGVWGLTGSPTPQAPTDAFGQCKLVTPENYRGHFTSFKHETMRQVTQFKWVPRQGHDQTVASLLKPAIRFERTVCSDMKPCFIDRLAMLSAEQQAHYKDLLQEAVTEIRGSTVTAVNGAVLIQKIVQAACGVLIGAGGELLKIDFGPRLKVLEELIEENQEKVLVFVPFTGALEAVATELRKRWSVAVVDGSVTPSKRLETFRAFRAAKDPHVLVCHPQCMAHGLDLTAASLSIWYAPYWRAEIYQQANARMDGSKQKAKIDIAHIYATAEERRIYNVLKEKGHMQDAILELAKGGVR